MSEYTTTSKPKPKEMDAPLKVDIADRLPPYDLGAELALLGSLVICPEFIDDAASILTAEMFFDERNQIHFKTLLDLNTRNIPIDTKLISDDLKTKNLYESAGGIQHLSDIVNSVPSAAHYAHYARIVKDKAVLRNLIMACTKSLTDVYESGDEATTIVERAEQRIFDLSQKKITGDIVSASSSISDTLRIIDNSSGDKISGLPIGLVEVDNMLDGLHNGELIIIAARPSVGKSALMMGAVEHLTMFLNKKVGIFSLEMPHQQLTQRLISSRTGIDLQRVRRGMIYQSENESYQKAIGDIGNSGIFYDDTPGLTLSELRAKARRLKRTQGIDAFMIDYLQLMEVPGGKSENRQQDISSISRGIKGLARELDVPIVCLSQLNRASETQNRPPRASDLRESGAIEQDADVIILLHREDIAHRGDTEWMNANSDKINQANIIIAKQRNGPCDTVKATFNGRFMRFETYNPGV